MSTYSNRLQPALQNLLQRVVRFFHPRSSCTTTHISADIQRITTLNVSCMTISGERTEQLDVFCRVTGFMSDFLSFMDVEFLRFFHGAIHLSLYYPTLWIKETGLHQSCELVKCVSTVQCNYLQDLYVVQVYSVLYTPVLYRTCMLYRCKVFCTHRYCTACTAHSNVNRCYGAACLV